MAKNLYSEIIDIIERDAEDSGVVSLSNSALRQLYQDVNSPVGNQQNQEFVISPQPAKSPMPQPIPNVAQKQTAPAANQPGVPPVQTQSIDHLDLAQLKQVTDTCQKCGLCQTRTNGVFGDGNPNADLMFIGEGPGEDEDLQGLPFVGPAGQLLDKMIEAMQFQRQQVYIANIVKCRPPNNRNPFPEEASTCLPYLIRQIQLIQPKVIVLLGAVPFLTLLNKKGITRLHGSWDEFMGIKTMPTFHPAYLLRYPSTKREAWQDLQKVMAFFGVQPPVKTGR